MEIQLSNNYVLFASCKINQKSLGGYIKKTKDATTMVDMAQEEEKLLQKFPCVYGALQEGKTLQMYQKNDKVTAQIGRLAPIDGIDEKCFEISASTTSKNCFYSLILLEEDMRKKSKGFEKVMRRAYINRSGYYE